jgi:multimeric flavodoxin WrbA
LDPPPDSLHPEAENLRPKVVLGLVGSPRRLGNCEIFVKDIANHLMVPHELKLIRLPSLTIRPCRACYGCVMDKPCPNEDDMEWLLGQIAGADAVIMASPVYYLGAHSAFKNILDRGFLFFPYLQRTNGKPCILANMYGIKERMGVAPHTLRTLASFLCLSIKGSVNLRVALPGEVRLGRQHREKAARLADKLFSRKSVIHRSGCPFCGSEIVRIAGKRFICALCHGSFTIDREGHRVKVEEGGIFGTPEHMLLHKAWLRNMKDRFLKVRKETIKAVHDVKDVGEWIEP